MSYYVGIDLHFDNNFVGIIDKKDCRILSKKMPNDRPPRYTQKPVISPRRL